MAEQSLDRWTGKQTGFGVSDGTWWAQIEPHPNTMEVIDKGREVVVLTAEGLAEVQRAAGEKGWTEGHAAGRDYQGDGWNSDSHDPGDDNPYGREGK